MQRINEIPREKAVSDLLENSITPLNCHFTVHLEAHLSTEFGIDEESPFLPKLQSDCEKFANEAIKLWRTGRGDQGRIFKKNRGKTRLSYAAK